MTVVRDDPQALVAWLAPATMILKSVLDTGEDLRAAPLAERFLQGRAMAIDRWRREGILRIAPTGMPWSVNADCAEAAVASRQSPFCDGWEDWRPDPMWTVPPLPDGVSWDFDLTPTRG